MQGIPSMQNAGVHKLSENLGYIVK